MQNDGFIDLGEEAGDEFFAARVSAYLPNEEEAFEISIDEFWGREKAARNDRISDKGLICLYDAAAQKLGSEHLEDFRSALYGIFEDALRFNGSIDIINGKWRCMNFNAPITAHLSTAISLQNEDGDNEIGDQGVGSMFRNPFYEISEDPEKYQRREDVATTDEYTGNLKNSIPASGFLTNTFLIFDPVCIDLVAESGYFYDNIPVLAFEAKFPIPGKTYAKGYQGYTCLVYGTEVFPPPVVLRVEGFGALGLDSTIYDPLCNFTCRHGYCPDGACSYVETVNETGVSLVFSSDDDLVPFDSSTSYNPGDRFLYDTSMPSDVTLKINLVGTPIVWEDIDCSSISGEYAPGADGDTLGCIAASVSLCYQLYDGEETVSTSVIGVTKGDAPWDSPYTAEETLAICSNGTLDLLEDPDGDETEYVWPVSGSRGDHSGPPADYAIVNYANSQQRTIFTSATYPNGNHGQDLQTYRRELHVYALSSTHRTDATIINNALLTDVNAVTVIAEHIIERKTIRDFMSFVQFPWVDIYSGEYSKTVSRGLGTVPFDIINNYMNLPYNQWENLEGQRGKYQFTFRKSSQCAGLHFKRQCYAESAGVFEYDEIANLELESQCHLQPQFRQTDYNPKMRNTQTALSLLRSGMAVFNYLDGPNIQNLMGKIHQRIYTTLTEFDTSYNSLNPPAQAIHSAGLWTEFIKLWAKRIRNRHYRHLTDENTGRIAQLRAGWQQILDNTPTPQRRSIATAALNAINTLNDEIETTVVFNDAPFTLPDQAFKKTA
ncbi:hypothetical protein EYC80_000389 [Monilinia laxa]|uniref:Uncharacterized protein n=1 Tax=Monilinia laxa TaxID=61186 RepID=A0A5N6KAM3_MONLA|nr:hypothetical protein EYC80_000389 [Monilinia laxa]